LYSAVAAPRSVSLDTLAFIYIFPPFRVMTELSSVSYYSCQAHFHFRPAGLDHHNTIAYSHENFLEKYSA
jgi:hypothetical protein